MHGEILRLWVAKTPHWKGMDSTRSSLVHTMDLLMQLLSGLQLLETSWQTAFVREFLKCYKTFSKVLNWCGELQTPSLLCCHDWWRSLFLISSHFWVFVTMYQQFSNLQLHGHWQHNNLQLHSHWQQMASGRNGVQVETGTKIKLGLRLVVKWTWLCLSSSWAHGWKWLDRRKIRKERGRSAFKQVQFVWCFFVISWIVQWCILENTHAAELFRPLGFMAPLVSPVHNLYTDQRPSFPPFGCVQGSWWFKHGPLKPSVLLRTSLRSKQSPAALLGAPAATPAPCG